MATENGQVQVADGLKHAKYVYNSPEEVTKRLSKRLTYILRYGAVKEGLTVDENGFVPLDELTQLSLLSEHTREEILHQIQCSISYRTNHRFEHRVRDGRIEVRAAYLRFFEASPVHPGTNVKTLLECSMNYVLNNLDDYDLETFPDEEIIRLMLRRLKRQKKLTLKAMTALFVPTLTRIDLESVYLTNNALRALWKQCPNLKAISFKGCGYIMTDTVLSQIVKNLSKLERLNLCQCNHLTSHCLSILVKRLPHLSVLHAAGIRSLNFKSVLNFLQKASNLTFLDIYFMVYTSDEYEQLTKTAASKGVNLILREPKGYKQTEVRSDIDGNSKEVTSQEMTLEDSNSDVENDDAMNEWLDLVNLQPPQWKSGSRDAQIK